MHKALTILKARAWNTFTVLHLSRVTLLQWWIHKNWWDFPFVFLRIWGCHLDRVWSTYKLCFCSATLVFSLVCVYTAPCSCSWINVGSFLLWRTHSVSFTCVPKPFFLVSYTGNQHSPFWRHEWTFTVHKFFSGSHRSRFISYWMEK